MVTSRRRVLMCGLMAVVCAATLLTACSEPEPCAKSGTDLNETATAIQESLCLLAADIQAIPLRVGGADVGTDFFLSNNLPLSTDVLLGLTNLPGGAAPDPAAAGAAETPTDEAELLDALSPTPPEVVVDLPDGTQATLPIDVTVSWRVSGGGRIFQEDRNMAVLSGGLDQPNLQIGIVPPLVGLTDNPTVQARARPAVRLVADTSALESAAGTRAVAVTANPPPLPLPLDALPVPELLVMFEHDDLRGRALIVVPSRPQQPESVEPLVESLLALGQAVPAGVLERTVAFTEFAAFISGVKTLTGTLRGAGVKIVTAGDDDKDEIDDLNDTDLHYEPIITDLDWEFLNDLEAEDTLSSLAYLGLEDDRIQLYNAMNQSDDEGQLNITLGRLPLAFIRNLHTDAPQLDAYSPGSAHRGDAHLFVAHEPAGRRRGGTVFPEAHKIETFGDEFSSLSFH